MIYRTVSLMLASMSSVAAAHAKVQPLEPGQYQIGDPAIQQICLKKNGEWYGTTFNFGGTWINNPPGVNLKAVMWGNYHLEGHAKHGYANDSLTFLTDPEHGPLIVAWYDWFDDYSY